MCFSYEKESVAIIMFSVQDSTQHGCFKTSGNHFSWRNEKAAAPGSGQTHGRPGDLLFIPRGDTTRRRLAAEPLQPNGRVGDRENATIRSLLYMFSKKEHGILEFWKVRRQDILVWKIKLAGFPRDCEANRSTLESGANTIVWHWLLWPGWLCSFLER